MHRTELVSHLGRLLQSGNFELPVTSSAGFNLPDKVALRHRIDCFIRGSELSKASWLPQFNASIDEVLLDLYEDRTLPGLPARDIHLPGLPGHGVIPLAIVIADGSRPIFFVEQETLTARGQVDGPFVDMVEQHKADLVRIAHSVGRIESDTRNPAPGQDKWYEGTAFMVSDRLAMTNRHILERMIDNPSAGSDGPFILKEQYWLNFAAGPAPSSPRRFMIEGACYAGESTIGVGGDFSRLDLALLEIAGPERAGIERPPPLRVTLDPLKANENIAVIGYPAAPRIYVGAGVPPVDFETELVLGNLFDNRFGFKRCASGEITATPGFPGDSKGWTIKHDASTLSGNSGSPIISLDAATFAVNALHFSGTPRSANYGHVFNAIRAELTGKGVNIT